MSTPIHVKLEHHQAYAAAEVVSVAAVYILVSTAAVNAIDVSFLFPANWSPVERITGSGFLTGAFRLARAGVSQQK